MRFAKKLSNIIAKNIKLILRSKSSALIVILGPLLLILLVGAAFNTANVYGIRVGVFSEKYSPLTESIVEELNDRQFNAAKTESKENCIDSIRNGKINVCVLFPSNLNVKSESTITFYVDPSRINLVYIIMEGISAKVETKSEELSLQLTSNVLNVMEEAGNQVTDKGLLVDELQANTEDFENAVNKMLAAMSQLDLNANKEDFSFDTLESELNKLNTATNNSYIGLGKKIGRLKVAVDRATVQLREADKVKVNSINQLELIKKIITSEINYLKTIKSSMDDINTQINTVAVKSAQKIVSPIKTKIEPVTTKRTNLSFLFPTILVMVVMFISTLMASTLVIKEKTSTAYFRNFLTPTSGWMFILGNYLSNIVIVAVQLAVIFLVAIFFFGRELLPVLWSVAAALFFISTLFILLGILIGNIFKSEETGTLGAISISSLLLFFSNTILPTESLPMIVRKIAGFNPFIVSEEILRKILLFEIKLTALAKDIYILAGFALALFMLVAITNINVRRAK